LTLNVPPGAVVTLAGQEIDTALAEIYKIARLRLIDAIDED